MAETKSKKPRSKKAQEAVVDTKAAAPQQRVGLGMEQSIDILFQAVNLGQKAGVYSIQDAAKLAAAMATLNPIVEAWKAKVKEEQPVAAEQ